MWHWGVQTAQLLITAKSTRFLLNCFHTGQGPYLANLHRFISQIIYLWIWTTADHIQHIWYVTTDKIREHIATSQQYVRHSAWSESGWVFRGGQIQILWSYLKTSLVAPTIRTIRNQLYDINGLCLQSNSDAQSRLLGRVVPTWAKRVSQRWLAESVTAVMDAMFTPVAAHCTVDTRLITVRWVLIADVNKANMLEVRSNVKKNIAIGLFQSLM